MAKRDRAGAAEQIESPTRENIKLDIVNEIDAGHEYIAFGNGVTLYAGQTYGGHADDVMKAQIKETVKEHFEKELKIHRTHPEGKRMKVAVAVLH